MSVCPNICVFKIPNCVQHCVSMSRRSPTLVSRIVVVVRDPYGLCPPPPLHMVYVLSPVSSSKLTGARRPSFLQRVALCAVGGHEREQGSGSELRRHADRTPRSQSQLLSMRRRKLRRRNVRLHESLQHCRGLPQASGWCLLRQTQQDEQFNSPVDVLHGADE